MSTLTFGDTATVVPFRRCASPTANNDQQITIKTVILDWGLMWPLADAVRLMTKAMEQPRTKVGQGIANGQLRDAMDFIGLACDHHLSLRRDAAPPATIRVGDAAQALGCTEVLGKALGDIREAVDADGRAMQRHALARAIVRIECVADVAKAEGYDGSL